MNVNFSFILASKSPRRLSLLNYLGFNFKAINPDIEEINDIYTKKPQNLALENAILKGKAINENFYTLSADTIVYLEEKVIGKPKDREDALNILLSLNGKKHEVITALAISKKTKVLAHTIVTSEVNFNKLDKGLYENYLNIANYQDKAGAYAIQEHGSIFVKNISGSYTNIIGLPVEETMKLLAKYSILPNTKTTRS